MGVQVCVCVSACLSAHLSACVCVYSMRQTVARSSAFGEIGRSELLCDYVVAHMTDPHKPIHLLYIYVRI